MVNNKYFYKDAVLTNASNLHIYEQLNDKRGALSPNIYVGGYTFTFEVKLEDGTYGRMESSFVKEIRDINEHEFSIHTANSVYSFKLCS